ncbi:jg25723, partial [Pararge aegeria aegeria]
RVGDVISSVVNRYGVSWVVSAGNHGPALATVGAPPDIAQPILIGKPHVPFQFSLPSL